MKVYLSGPISGIKDLNRPAFDDEEKHQTFLGNEVVNPLKVGESVTSGKWEDYMKKDIIEMLSCDKVFALPGWTKSRGACLEVSIAQALGLVVEVSLT
jgi:hypothetical protein